MNAATARITLLAMALAAAGPALAAAGENHGAPPERAEYQAMMEDAERARAEAEAARREAASVAERAREAAVQQRQLESEDRELAERERERHRAEMDRVREELSRAHRDLREATRDLARAHREVSRGASTHAFVHELNLGDRAVIGVILGPQSEEGVEIIGVSPDGPAERAGLQAGDVLLSIRGEALSRDHGGRDLIHRVMEEAEPGETLAVVVDRDGQTWNFDIVAEQREPSSWQTLIQIPEAPHAPMAPDAPSIVVEHIEVPRIDEEALNRHLQELTEELHARKFRFVMPEGLEPGADGEWALPESFDFEVLEFSELAEDALRESSIWFGLPQSSGLELATVNEGLGAYFKTKRGVLVLDAREDNAYSLRSGDVVMAVNDRAVDTPADLMRALREIDPGEPVTLAIMRDRRDRTLEVTMPENRLGFAPVPPPPPSPFDGGWPDTVRKPRAGAGRGPVQGFPLEPPLPASNNSGFPEIQRLPYMAGQSDSLKSILFALFANSAIAVAKGVAALVTGSGAMLAEAIHSVADAGNQLLLILGLKQTRKSPTEDHPLGFGKSIYFWSFLVAVILFSLGGMFSVYEGVHKLTHPEPLSHPWIAIAVLVFAIVAESISLWGCMREVNKERFGRSILQWFRQSRSSALIVVFGEDVAALLGLVFALAAVFATMVTGNPFWDAAGTVTIGVLLIVIAVFVAIEVKQLLIGQSVEPSVQAEMDAFLRGRPEILELYNLLTMQFGPDAMVAIKARMVKVGSDHDLVVAINRVESDFRTRFPSVTWLFFEPDVDD